MEKVLGVNPIVLKKDLKELTGEVKFAKILQDGALMLLCGNDKQKKKAMSIKMICKQKVESCRMGGQRMWMITGVPLGITIEEVTRNLEGGKVMKATCLKMNRA